MNKLEGGERERLTELYFLTVKIVAQRPTHISAIATVLLITKTFTVKYYGRRLQTNTTTIIIMIIIQDTDRQKLTNKNKSKKGWWWGQRNKTTSCNILPGKKRVGRVGTFSF